jgi:hypothetical protein
MIIRIRVRGELDIMMSGPLMKAFGSSGTKNKDRERDDERDRKHFINDVEKCLCEEKVKF